MDQQNETINLEEVCRTCLLPSKCMRSIFSAIEVPNLGTFQLTILDLLKIFTKLEVSPNDGFSDYICSDCVEKLYQSYTFKLNWLKSETISRTILKDSSKHLNEYEHNTGRSIPLIRKENTEDYETSNEKELEQYTSEHSTVFHVQEVKQEPEINIEVDFKETESDEKHFKTKKRNRTINTPLKCEICGKIFRYKVNLRNHMEMAHTDGTTNNKNFNCAYCTKFFIYEFQLNRHMILHVDKEKPFHCELCPRKFRLKNNLENHKQIAHIDGTAYRRRFDCTICSKLFEYKFQLNRHMRMHTREKPYQCEVCPKNFRFMSSLKNHMLLTHTDGPMDSKFKCTTCLKLFVNKRTLSCHLRIHTGEKPFECEICSKTFRLKGILKTHMENSHTDGTMNRVKFQCTICSKLFGTKSNLNQHMLIHTGEKPFQCEICREKFRSKNNLNVHMRRKHDIETQKKQ